MTGHSRSKNRVASARLCRAIQVFVSKRKKEWITGTSPVMTTGILIAASLANDIHA
jgi:hypothetical protein